MRRCFLFLIIFASALVASGQQSAPTIETAVKPLPTRPQDFAQHDPAAPNKPIVRALEKAAPPVVVPASPPPAKPAGPRPDMPPRIPATAVKLALADTQQILKAYGPIKGAEVNVQRRWIWLPTASADELADARGELNIAVSHSPVDYIPATTGGGALVPVDLAALCPDAESLAHAIKTWNSLSDIEFKFHDHIFGVENVLVDCDEYFDPVEKRKFKKRWEQRKTFISTAARHLGPAGIALENAIGNASPATCSYCPIVDVNWFTYAALASIDGAKYLEFRGLEVGKTKLDEYLISRGVPRENIEKIDSDQREGLLSHVTGNTRGVRIYQGHGTRPTVGPQIVMVTDDHLQINQTANHSPFASLLDAVSDAHEVLLTLPNGWIEYTLWDGKNLLLAEAVDTVVSDHRIPEPFLTRLQGAISCVRCHGPDYGWQPARNEVQDMWQDRGRVLFDISKSAKGQDADQLRVDLLFQGDFRFPLKEARHTFDGRCFAVTGLGARELSASLAARYAAHEFAWVTPRIACEDMGFSVPADDPNGTVTFRRVVPARGPGLVEDPINVRLYTDYFDEDAGKRVALAVTRREWELVFGDDMVRAYPALAVAPPAPVTKEKEPRQ